MNAPQSSRRPAAAVVVVMQSLLYLWLICLRVFVALGYQTLNDQTDQERLDSRLQRLEAQVTGLAETTQDLQQRPAARDDRLCPQAARDLVPETATLLLATGSGFLIDVDERDLVDAAVEHRAVVYVERDPGDSIVEGTPIGWVWGVGGAPLAGDDCVRLMAAVCSRISLGFERTSTSDVGLGVRQLTDVALKALSPGINDPTTAVHALGHSSSLLCELAAQPLGPRVLRDDDDAVRVVLSRPVLADLLAVAVEQPAHYGSTDPYVMRRLFALLRELAWAAGTRADAPVSAQLARLRRSIAVTDFDPIDRQMLEAEATRVDEALASRWDQTGRDH